jgi:hypothetical protein
LANDSKAAKLCRSLHLFDSLVVHAALIKSLKVADGIPSILALREDYNR